MNKVLFQCKYFKLRVREALFIIIVLILLFFVFKSCENQAVEKKKEAKIAEVCTFTSEDIKDFHKLFERADLCSEGWFKDLDAYIARIEDQNSYLKKRDQKDCKTVLRYQKRFFKDLKAFKKDQSQGKIEDLEKSFKDYKQYYDTHCGKGKKG